MSMIKTTLLPNETLLNISLPPICLTINYTAKTQYNFLLGVL